MATAKQRAWRARFAQLYGKKRGASKRMRRTRVRGVRMAKRRGGFKRAMGGSPGSFITSVLMGMGAAAVAKRFIGAPLGGFTGAAAGAGTSMVFKGNMIGAAAGGWLHDNIGNVGGATGGAVAY